MGLIPQQISSTLKKMKEKHKILLLIDGLVNIVLGLLLLLFPFGIADFLGIPKPITNFYPTIFGGVIFGIGIALLIERFGEKQNIRGLGLGGAIAINFCGAGVLLIWLLSKSLNIPLKGYIILWAVAIVVLGCGLIEIIKKSWKY